MYTKLLARWAQRFSLGAPRFWLCNVWEPVPEPTGQPRASFRCRSQTPTLITLGILTGLEHGSPKGYVKLFKPFKAKDIRDCPTIQHGFCKLFDQISDHVLAACFEAQGKQLRNSRKSSETACQIEEYTYTRSPLFLLLGRFGNDPSTFLRVFQGMIGRFIPNSLYPGCTETQLSDSVPYFSPTVARGFPKSSLPNLASFHLESRLLSAPLLQVSFLVV